MVRFSDLVPSGPEKKPGPKPEGIPRQEPVVERPPEERPAGVEREPAAREAETTETRRREREQRLADLKQIYAFLHRGLESFISGGASGGIGVLVDALQVMPPTAPDQCQLAIDYIQGQADSPRIQHAVALAFLLDSLGSNLGHNRLNRNLSVVAALYSAWEFGAHRVGLPLDAANLKDAVLQAEGYASRLLSTVRALAAGTQAPLPSRVDEETDAALRCAFGVCDIYLTYLLNKAESRGANPARILKYLIETAEAGQQRKVVKALIDELSLYPQGSLVRLNTREIGIVEQTRRDAPLRPVVRLLRDADGNRLPGDRSINLASHPFVYVKEIVSDSDARLTNE